MKSPTAATAGRRSEVVVWLRPPSTPVHPSGEQRESLPALAPHTRETFLGNAEVLEVFNISKVGKVAGVKVTEGVVRKGAKVRILRDNVVIQEMGTLTTLKRFKEEVDQVQTGQECGMSFGQFQDIKQGDFIECFNVEVVQRSL